MMLGLIEAEEALTHQIGCLAVQHIVRRRCALGSGTEAVLLCLHCL